MPTRSSLLSTRAPTAESGQWVVRAWVPEAETVELILDGERLLMQTPHHPWVFEAECSRDPGHTYKLQIAEADSSTSNSILGPFGMNGWAKWIAICLQKAITITFGDGWEPTDANKVAFRG